MPCHGTDINRRLGGIFQQSERLSEEVALLMISLKERPLAIVCMIVDTADMAARPDEFIPTRESLLSRIKDWGDRESWQDFFDTYWRLIYSTARKAGLTDAEAQDIVQETVLSVAKNIEGFKYDPAVCSFKTWMLQSTRWRILNQLKRREREQAGPMPGLAGSSRPARGDDTDRTATLERLPDPAGVDLEAVWDEEWEKHLLATALERLKRRVDPEQLQVFDLYCLEQWPARKVARTLGVNLGRVYLAKHRVGRMLKKEIQTLRQTHP
jgi:RNA polymerase sigma factor (sigma-70 family)